MANSCVIITRKRSLFVARICSKCGFPTIAEVYITARATESYFFSEAAAAKTATETAWNAIENETEQIELCYKVKKGLSSKKDEFVTNEDGHSCLVSVSNIFSPCSMCFNVEPWMVAKEEQLIDGLDAENFPRVFRTRPEAEKWASDQVSAMITRIASQREDASMVERAVDEVKELIAKIAVLEHQNDILPEATAVKKKKRELETTVKQRDGLGLLNFKARIGISKRIKELEIQLKELEDILDKTRMPIFREIAKLRKRLTFIQAVAFGCATGIVTQKIGYSFGCRFHPNEIPGDILESIMRRTDDMQEQRQLVDSRLQSDGDNTIQNNEMFYCRKCGFKLLPDSVFCTKCGEKVH